MQMHVAGSLAGMLAEITEVKEGYSGLVTSGIIVLILLGVAVWWLKR